MNFDSKENGGKQSIIVIYPNEENTFIVPNLEKKGDYYMHQSLSQLKGNFNSKENDGKKSIFYETKVLMSFIPMTKICLWCLIMKIKEIIKCIHVCPY